MRTHSNMSNLEIAQLLRSVAAAYEVKNGSPNTRFRLIAYQRAADAVEHATSELKDLWQEGKLDEVAGVGKAIAEHLDELFKTGKVGHFNQVMGGLPQAMFEFLGVPGIGAKRAYLLSKKLGITKAHGALEKLQKAAEKGHIRKLEGFGEQSEKEILEAIKKVKARTRRLLLPFAWQIASEIVGWLKKNTSIAQAEPLGSLRRKVSTVGDIDIAVASRNAKQVIEHFTNYPKKIKVLEAGEATSSILLPGGVQVDLMVQPPESFGALLQHFTGSKHHNIALRNLALKKGLSLSEYGIKKVRSAKLPARSASPARNAVSTAGWQSDAGGKVQSYSTEETFYEALGMAWIPPELREDQGEIEAALQGKLPKLVEPKDVKGDLHLHSNYPQETSHDAGEHSMEEMTEEARRLGYEYIAFTEHNPRAGKSQSKILDILKRKKERTDKLNEKKIINRVFNSLEVDIQPSGSLALPDKAFELLDFAIVAVHSSFKGSKEKQTKRVLAALEHPKVKIFAHPTARRLGRREEIDYSWEKIFEICIKRGILLEINASDDRLDLPDILVREAIKNDVKLAISTDAHSLGGMRNIPWGVYVARRGWAEADNIANTLPLTGFLKILVLK